MNTKFKWTEKTTTILLYVGAALLVVAILCVSIFAFVSQNRKNKVPDTSAPITNGTQPPIGTNQPPATEAPVTQPPTTSSAPGANEDPPAKPSYRTPVQGTVSKGYDTETLVYSVTMNDYRVHNGVDLEAPVGTPVYAMADGKILKVYNDYLMGTCLEIDHGQGLVSCYRNLQEALPEGIAEGAKVTAGQLIAGVGETAIVEQSDETHLHFEVKKNGVLQNPMDYIKIEEAKKPAADKS